MERFSGFDGDDDESGGNGDFTFNVDGTTNNDADHRPSTPRSKHSAMEQRRRSKINERFQVLRELIPHSDQKRDKASLLLEVIEHIRSLHEKVQKYESSYPGPGWIEENAKSMPWGEVYFRSCWKNAQNNSPCPGDGIVDPSQDVQNGSLSPGFILSRNDNTPISVPSVAQNLTENDINAGVSYKAAENTSGFAREVAASSVPHPNLYASVSMIDGVSQSQQLISDADNMASLADTPWLRSPFLPDCPLIDDTLNGQELGINEGTISVSCAYSNGLLTTLSRTLQSSGIDLSQASISVDINLGKRATSRRPSVTTTMSTAKDPKDPSSGEQVVGHSRVGSSVEDTEEAHKRQKSDNRRC